MSSSTLTVCNPRVYGNTRFGLPYQHDVQLQYLTTKASQSEFETRPPSTEPSDTQHLPTTKPMRSRKCLPLEVHLFQEILPSALVLKNTGSVARDHLASERTFLAYMRTSLMIAGSGVAMVQIIVAAATDSSTFLQVDTVGFFNLGTTAQRLARPIGTVTVFLGLCVLPLGLHRYFEIQKAMMKGVFPPARGSVILLTALLAALVGVTFGIFLTLP